MTKYVFVTGGVLSSLGKGVAVSSIAHIVQSMGYSIMIKKMDPYLNVDPGTLNPYEHGEVFVTEDGAETDLDLGYYERFTGVKTGKLNNITTGKVYEIIIEKERKGEYCGKTVQVVPHVINEIKDFVKRGTEGKDFVFCEIGGTVGDIEVLPFLEAVRQMKNELGKSNVANIHLTLLPYVAAAEELKTKPTQSSVRELLSVGIQADFLLCRTQKNITNSMKDKISLFCNIPSSRIIEAIDTDFIYNIPILFNKQKLGEQIAEYFQLNKKSANLIVMENFTKKYYQTLKLNKVRIGIVGKYVDFKDAYKSLNEALINSGVHSGINICLSWINSESTVIEDLQDLNGVVVPGGFGGRGIAGKLLAIQYARERNVPFLGICFGMQLALIEFARNVLKIVDANSTEIDPNTKNPIVSMINDWEDNKGSHRIMQQGLGGTMRLGGYKCWLTPDTCVSSIYNKESVVERHRHRYEVNLAYKESFEKAGMIFSGLSEDRLLTEIVEIPANKWFVATQFHPELSATPLANHPLFCSFVRAAGGESHSC